eukprot:3283307-Rhodomonas_salina.2
MIPSPHHNFSSQQSARAAIGNHFRRARAPVGISDHFRGWGICSHYWVRIGVPRLLRTATGPYLEPHYRDWY